MRRRSTISNLRWWIGGMLFASTVINYVDRQTLSVLAPFLKKEYSWTNQDYAMIVIAFRVAYSIGQTMLGRFIDRVGTRLGLTVTVTWYSVIAMLTSLASGLQGFAFFRFMLGLGESPNWPAATKAVSEWFPKKERGWAVALFDSGSSIGAAIAPALVIWLYHSFGGWRPAFLITGTLGFIWLIAWRMLYYTPQKHPRISEEERKMILDDHEKSSAEYPETEAVLLEVAPAEGVLKKGVQAQGVRAKDAHATDAEVSVNLFQPVQKSPSWFELLRLRQTWGIIAGRGLSDPVWFFIADWFMIYLVSKGFSPEDTLVAFWIPFVAADLGNFAGGGFSSFLIKHGWSVGRARKAVIIFGTIGMTLLIPTAFMSNLFAIAGLFGLATFAYCTLCTMVLVLPSDLYHSHSVATVSGLSGTAAGILTIVSTYLVGWISDAYSFTPILIAASMLPVIGMVLMLVLIRNTKETGKGILIRI